MVALVSASPVLYAFPVSHNAWVIFLATALAIHAREIIKDMEDIGADEGYKWTLIQFAGERGACVVAGMLFVLSAVVLLHLKLGGISTVLVSGQIGENAIVLLVLTVALQIAPRVVAPAFKLILDVWVAYYLLVIAISGVP
jgi:4-hydroxybenzoate polyprenyltransferase